MKRTFPELESEPSIRQWLRWLYLSLILLGLFGHESSQAQETDELWPIGSEIFAEVVEPPDILETHSPGSGWFISNTLLYNGSTHVSERHRYLDPHQILRVRVVDESWAQILPEYNRPNPQTYDSDQAVFIPLENLRTVDSSLSEPLSVFPETAHHDKLIVVIHNNHSPEILAYEGEKLVLRTPVVLGDTPYGDWRIWRKRLSDDMPGIPGVPSSQCFSGGYCLHGSPWWNWRYLEQGHYGSHGCVNLPDSEWYTLLVGEKEYSIDDWLFRWTNSGLPFDVTDARNEEVSVLSTEEGWYEPTKSVRVLVVHSIEELVQLPFTYRLGPAVSAASVRNWLPLIEAYHATNGTWVLPKISGEGNVSFDQPLQETSRAESEGEQPVETITLLQCNSADQWNDPLSSTSSLTKGNLCEYFASSGSTCTFNTQDPSTFGQGIYCDERKFHSHPIDIRGELIEHEGIHSEQMSSTLTKQLYDQGLPLVDPDRTAIDISQPTLRPWLEFGAQNANQGSPLEDDYQFALVGWRENGTRFLYKSSATVTEVWGYLHSLCGDPTGSDPILHDLIERASRMDPLAYQELTNRCGHAPHEIVGDYTR